MPFFTQWVQQVLNIDLTLRNVPRQQFSPQELPSSCVPTGQYLSGVFYKINSAHNLLQTLKTFSDFLNALIETKIDYTMDGLARLSRSHGQTLYDIYSLRHGKCFPRICDMVVWPGMYC